MNRALRDTSSTSFENIGSQREKEICAEDFELKKLGLGSRSS